MGSVQVVGAEGGAAGTAHMENKEVSATDAAVRQRIHKLGVHIPCGQIRGPVPPRTCGPAYGNPAGAKTIH